MRPNPSTTKKERLEFKEAYEKKAILSEISRREFKQEPPNEAGLILSTNNSVFITYLPNKDEDLSIPQNSIQRFSLRQEDITAWKSLCSSFLTVSKEIVGSFRFLCKLCGKEFLKGWQAYHHVDSKHLPHVQHSCDHCPLMFKRRQQLNRHVKTKHVLKHEDKSSKIFYCAECRKEWPSKHTYISHMKCHKGLLKHKCTDCSAAYTLKTDLRYHVLSKHKQEYRFWCFLCGKGFVLNSFLNKHKDSHNPPSIKCRYCETKFQNNQHVKKHEQSHFGIKQFECNMCPKKYIHKDNMRVHKKKHLKYHDKKYQISIKKCEVKLPSLGPSLGPRLRKPEIWLPKCYPLPFTKIQKSK